MAFTLANIELAEKTLEHLRHYPALHDQGNWLHIDQSTGIIGFHAAFECGTAGCFAGWAALLNGAELSIGYDESGYNRAVRLPDGELVEDYAARALGLGEYLEDDGEHMFDTHNTLEDLAEWVSLMREAYEKGQGAAEVTIAWRSVVNA